MNHLRSAVLPVLALCAILSGQPTPPPLNSQSAEIASVTETAEAVSPNSGIDWSRVEPNFADLTGIYPKPADTADPWLEPEKFTDCAKVACVALTFDDGPLPGHTDAILEILEQQNATATFFVVGQLARNYPDLLMQMVDGGHEIAAHSYAHARLTELGNDNLRRDFDKTNAILRELTGVTPAYYRPPYGMHNQRVRAAAESPTVMWSIDPQDWRKTTSASQMVSYVLARSHPGAIVLFHDKMAKTAKALPAIIDGLREQGYELVTVAEVLGTQLNPEAVYRSGLIPPVTDPVSD